MKAKFEQAGLDATEQLALESPLEVVESFESTGKHDNFISNFGSHLEEIINQESDTHGQAFDLQYKINSNVNVVQRNQGPGMTEIHEEGSRE
jgi:hypothetical protein